MKTINEIRLENARHAMGEANVTATELARRMGAVPQSVFQVLGKNPVRNIGDKFARRIEVALALPLGWLDQERYQVQGSPVMGGRAASPQRGVSSVSARPVLVWDSEDELGGDYALIPRLDVKASAGNGKVIWSVDEKGQRQAFRKAWIERLGIAPDDAATIVAEGSSMAPRIEDGDSLVVNYRDQSIVSGKVYVLTINDELFVKRVFKTPSAGLRIVSDNADKSRYPDWDIGADQLESVHILARVVALSGAI